MDSRSGAGREALIHALAADDWPWAPALRLDLAFVDGICELADACARAGIAELALAAAVAGEAGEQSALARLLLVWYRAQSIARARRVDSQPPHISCDTLGEAFNAARARGITDFILPR